MRIKTTSLEATPQKKIKECFKRRLGPEPYIKAKPPKTWAEAMEDYTLGR